MAEVPSLSIQESWEGCVCWCFKTVEEKEAWAAAGQGGQAAFGKADFSEASPCAGLLQEVETPRFQQNHSTFSCRCLVAGKSGKLGGGKMRKKRTGRE